MLVLADGTRAFRSAERPAHLVELPRQLGQLRRPVLELDLAKAHGFLATLDRRRPELDGTERAAAILDGRLGLRDRRLARVELGRPDAQLRLAKVELGGALSENLLDAEVQLAGALLAMLELLDRGANLDGALLELAAAFRDEVGHGIRGVGRREQPPKAAARPVVRRAAPGPLLPFPIVLRVSLHRLGPSVAPATHPQPSSSEWPPAPSALSARLDRLLPKRGGRSHPSGGGLAWTPRI